MEFSYRKNNNDKLFESVTQSDGMNLTEPQNFIPLYTRFFDLNEKNCDAINLNNNSRLISVDEKLTDNLFACSIDENETLKEKNVFFKFSPLIDPIKYMMGKYDMKDSQLLELPNFDGSKGHTKATDINNAAYVDSFFTYLTSQMLNSHNFVHALDFYGSFLAKKHDFKFNIADDVEYLNESDFFHENRGSLFDVDNTFANGVFNFNTRKNKERLDLVGEDIKNDDILELSDISDLKELESLFIEKETSNEEVEVVDKSKEALPDLLMTFDLKDKKLDDGKEKTNGDSDSDCSSRSSVTDGSDNEDDSDEDDDDSDEYSTASEDMLFATLTDFPVQVIALEKCEKTLDSLIMNEGEDMPDDEWGSMLIQVIMMLLAYQKTYQLTHNDLHTNNIMYVSTDKPYLYYKYDSSYYKVPTFGRIYKIIDFGRAIYKFRGNVICSDSYHPKGDAATLYNFEPYFNEEKPRLEPNFSFDLCRLGCAILDFIIDDLEDEPKHPRHAAKRIIRSWCMDDKGRNILYKKNGDERYPNFKLYKMIARTVHNHTPDKVIQNGYFDRFKSSKKKISKSAKIMSIDDLPCYA